MLRLALPGQRCFISHQAVDLKGNPVGRYLITSVQNGNIPNKHLCVGYKHFLAISQDLDIDRVLLCIELLELQILLIIITSPCKRIWYDLDEAKRHGLVVFMQGLWAV